MTAKPRQTEGEEAQPEETQPEETSQDIEAAATTVFTNLTKATLPHPPGVTVAPIAAVVGATAKRGPNTWRQTPLPGWANAAAGAQPNISVTGRVGSQGLANVHHATLTPARTAQIVNYPRTVAAWVPHGWTVVTGAAAEAEAPAEEEAPSE